MLKWSFAKWNLGLLFKEIRFGISLNQQVIHAYCARPADWFRRVQQRNRWLPAEARAVRRLHLLLEKEK